MRRTLCTLALSAVALVPFSARAGYNLPAQGVVIDDNAKRAGGSMQDTRFSWNGTEEIGCYTQASSSGNTVFGMCAAKNAAGISRSCQVPDGPAENAMIAVIQTIDRFSHVGFTWDANGFCTVITVQKLSSLLE